MKIIYILARAISFFYGVVTILGVMFFLPALDDITLYAGLIAGAAAFVAAFIPRGAWSGKVFRLACAFILVAGICSQWLLMVERLNLGVSSKDAILISEVPFLVVLLVILIEVILYSNKSIRS